MRNYTEQELLKLAKRYNNNKRSYLLVNPLQAKHLPVSPTASLSMMDELGARLCRAYPGTKLVIGFAETATAIGAGVASAWEGCTYIHTTRECMSDVAEWVYFSEEHSHAVEQKLCAEHLCDMLDRTDTIIFVDDELSTGKTLLNIVDKLRRQFPQAAGKPVVIATIINRVSADNIERLAKAGITCEQLLKLENIDYSLWVNDYPVAAPASVAPVAPDTALTPCVRLNATWPNPRRGLDGAEYRRACRRTAAEVMTGIPTSALDGRRVVVLGTEECMFPAITLGQEIEKQFPTGHVVSHSTTRSPISVCAEAAYPIRNGYHIHSFYETDRDTFLYNIAAYDTVIVVTDSAHIPADALHDLQTVFAGKCSEMYLVGG